MTESLFTYSMNTQIPSFLWNNTEISQVSWDVSWVEKGGCPSHHKKTKGLLNVWGGPSSKASLRAEDGAGSLPYSEQPCETQLNWKESIVTEESFPEFWQFV